MTEAQNEEVEIQRRTDCPDAQGIKLGGKTGEVCSHHSISEATFYNWKSKFAGMEVQQIRHLTGVENELSELKQTYAELAIDHCAIMNVLSRKG